MNNDGSDEIAQNTITHNPEIGDWYLSEFIRFANKGMQFPITLYCHGLIVSGILIGGKDYFQLCAGQVGEAFSDPEAKSTVQEWVKSFAAIYPEPVEENETEREIEVEESAPSYIHVKDAKVFVPGQKPIPDGAPGMLWRGRIASVDAFTWGRLAVSA